MQKYIFFIIFIIGIQTIQGMNKELPPFLAAVKKHDLKALEQLIQDGGDVDQKNDADCTALILAADHGYRDCVELLINAKANINQVTVKNANALMWAIHKYRSDCAQFLIKAGSSVNQIDADGDTALMHAVLNRDTATIKLLINAKADVNHTKRGGLSPLAYAALTDRPDYVYLLIDAGVNLYMNPIKDWTPLLFAANFGRSTAEILVERMLNLPKEKVIAFLICLKKKNYDGQYHNLHNIFMQLLKSFIRECRTRTRAEIEKIENAEKKKNLLNKYFGEQSIWPVII